MDVLSKPVTVERIKEAYEACGFNKLQGDFIAGNSCCGLSAIALAETEQEPGDLQDLQGLGDSYYEMAAVLDASIEEVLGFAYGFDGFQVGILLAAFERENLDDWKACEAAFKLGQDAWDALQ